jgi:hypothetical protein
VQARLAWFKPVNMDKIMLDSLRLGRS